ncbi:ribonuclease HII-like [Uloborus diversus]|uniref:ribonuclease HII-like n=1 Tax=Uloborus diversus TaxID=327109 RepID=UPI00240943B2|nr:ribonuclease HII-like [Uloborus diversus]
MQTRSPIKPKEDKILVPNLDIENSYPHEIVAGVDEAGRGPLAGPVIAAAVVINQSTIIPGIKDSKLMTKLQRERCYTAIMEHYQCGVGEASVEEIDEHNILEATKLACIRAVNNLSITPTKVIVDGNMKFSDARFISVVRGDQSCYSVAVASVVAKVTRDRIMHKLHDVHPVYGWVFNSGYGTKMHVEAIKDNGYTIHHRLSFKVKGWQNESLESLNKKIIKVIPGRSQSILCPKISKRPKRMKDVSK